MFRAAKTRNMLPSVYARSMAGAEAEDGGESGSWRVMKVDGEEKAAWAPRSSETGEVIWLSFVHAYGGMFRKVRSEVEVSSAPVKAVVSSDS